MPQSFSANSMQTALRDAEDRSLSGFGHHRYAVPDLVELAGGRLIGDWSAGFHDEAASAEMLTAFLRLPDGSDADVLAFARRWGILDMCPTHDLPAGHDASFDHLHLRALPGPPGVCFGTGPRFADQAHALRRYAAWCRSLVSLAALLRSGVRLLPADVDGHYGRLLAGPMHPELAGQLERRLPLRLTSGGRVDRDDLGATVQSHVNGLIASARIDLRVWWDGDRFGAMLAGHRIPGLLGAVAGQVYLTVAGQSLHLCDHCGNLYQPARKPAVGRRAFCDDCRAERVPTRLSARAHYERKRAQA